MEISDFDFELPQELIAQKPPKERGTSRMMVLKRDSKSIEHKNFSEFPEYLMEGDIVVINATRVMKARLIGMRRTGGRVEILLLRRKGENLWEALGRPAKRLKKGEEIKFMPDLKAIIEEEGEMGKRLIHFLFPIERELEKIGRIPLPPYIRREPEKEDEKRYQTIFAKQGTSVAAPTAGLHFTEEILEKIRKKAEMIEIVHNVGEATFRPLRKKEVEKNELPPEDYFISESASEKLRKAEEGRKRIIAIGTTVVRALESSYNNRFSPGLHSTSLFIYPGYQFKVVKAMLTNFHLPRSSLILLVSAFGGRNFLLKAYKEAIRQRYRFYSYGDCMLIL